MLTGELGIGALGTFELATVGSGATFVPHRSRAASAVTGPASGAALSISRAGSAVSGAGARSAVSRAGAAAAVTAPGSRGGVSDQ